MAKQDQNTPENRLKLYQAIAEKTGQFDYSQPGSNNAMDLRGTSSPSPYGANTSGEGEYVAWYSPMGGSSFIGVKVDGSKEVISKDDAVRMGFVPQPSLVGDFEIGNNQTTPYVPAPLPGGGGSQPPPPSTGGTNNPPPTGGGDDPFTPPPGGGGINWDWGQGNPGAPPLDGGGGYDPNDYAFQRYVPGQESPWGIPEVEGGNKDFYRNQFVNLLQHSQNAQNNEIGAAIRRQYAEENPLPSNPIDWSWADLPNVDVAQQPQQGEQFPSSANTLASWVKPGVTTNLDILRNAQATGALSQEDFSKFDLDNPSYQQTNWSTAKSPEHLLSYIGPDISEGHRQRHSDIYNSIFTTRGLETPEGGGPTAAAGYALPVSMRSA